MIKPKIPVNPYSTRPMIIGEGEGKNEIEQGEYFVGRSGELLNSILEKLGLDRNRIYINNVMRFNSVEEIRTPTPKDIEEARPRLMQEIIDYKPKVILLLGSVALRAVLKKNGIRKHRGMLYTLELPELSEPIIVLPTLHPSAILRKKRDYDTFYHDLVKFKELIMNKESATESSDKLLSTVKSEYVVVNDINTLSQIQEKLTQEKEKISLALDIETTKLSPFDSDSKIMTIAFYSNKPEYRFVIDVSTDTEFAYKAIELIKYIISNPNITLIIHNALFDLLFLAKRYGFWGSDIKCRVYDTLLFQYLYNENVDRGLKRLVAKYFNVSNYSIIEDSKGIDYEKESMDTIMFYNFQDSFYTWKLAKYLIALIKKQKADVFSYYKIMEQMIPILIDMRIRGMKLDTDYLSELDIDFRSQLETLQIELELQAKTDLGVEKFNINSTKQLKEYLFDYLQIEPLLFTNTHAPSTNKEALDKILSNLSNTKMKKSENVKKAIEFIEKLKEYKKVAQAYKLYVKQMKELMDSHGFVHTALRLDGTVTGRLSSMKPNLQNISRNEKIKKLFIPRAKEWYIGENDLSQIELRVIAFMSGDPTMIHAYETGQDLHKITASKVFNIPFDQVAKEQRTKAKSVNFGISYMQSANGLADNLNISVKTAEKIINDYFKQFPRVKEFIEEIKAFARIHGYVKTPFGKYRHLPEIRSSVSSIRAGAERQAVNCIIQSTASTLNLLGIIELDRQIRKHNLLDYIFIVNTVHDSVVMEFHKDLLYDLAKILKYVFWGYLTQIMQDLFGRGIIKSDFKYGYSWGETNEFDFEKL